MENPNATVIWSGVKATKALNGFVRHRLERWLELELGIDFSQWEGELAGREPLTYSVRIQREGWPALCSCEVRVRMGARSWVSGETSLTWQRALTQTLRHLHGEAHASSQERTKSCLGILAASPAAALI